MRRGRLKPVTACLTLPPELEATIQPAMLPRQQGVSDVPRSSIDVVFVDGAGFHDADWQPQQPSPGHPPPAAKPWALLLRLLSRLPRQPLVLLWCLPELLHRRVRGLLPAVLRLRDVHPVSRRRTACHGWSASIRPWQAIE